MSTAVRTRYVVPMPTATPIDLSRTPLDSGSWDETFAVLSSIGLPGGEVYNTGGGCLVLQVEVESGAILWVTGAEDNVSSRPTGHEVEGEDGTVSIAGEGWMVAYYCRECRDFDCEDHEAGHAFYATPDSSFLALVDAVQCVLRKVVADRA